MSLVTIKKSPHESELLILKSKLESEGVRCFLRNEYTTQILTHMANFEVELQVSSNDMERVIEIMDSIEKE